MILLNYQLNSHDKIYDNVDVIDLVV